MFLDVCLQAIYLFSIKRARSRNVAIDHLCYKQCTLLMCGSTCNMIFRGNASTSYI